MIFKVSALALLILLAGCHKHELEWEDPAIFHADVKVNGEDISFGIRVNGEFRDTLISLNMERASSDGLHWSIGFVSFSKESQTLLLRELQSIPNPPPYAIYGASCCIPVPDYLVYFYDVLENDSVNNYLNVVVDTTSHGLTGSFKMTFVNVEDPFDTIRMSCEEFACYWE